MTVVRGLDLLNTDSLIAYMLDHTFFCFVLSVCRQRCNSVMELIAYVLNHSFFFVFRLQFYDEWSILSQEST